MKGGGEVIKRDDRVRVARPLFQAAEGGSTPTSSLSLWFSEVSLDVAKPLNRLWHSRFPDFGGGGSRVCHAAEFDGLYYAVAIWTNPSSPKLPQRAWLMMKRWAIAPDAPPNTGSRMEMWMVRAIHRKFPEVAMLVSYSDPETHDGAIYKACNWLKGATTKRKSGGKQWQNRERGKHSNNETCRWVTRWTKELR